MTVLQYSGPPHISLAKMPGRYGMKNGYVYAVFCSSRVVKIGSSVCPGTRIGEQCRSGYIFAGRCWLAEKAFRVNRIILSGAHRRCREFERMIHTALNPFRQGHYKSEKYRLSCEVMDNLKKLFSTPLTESRITAFTKQTWNNL